VPTSSPVFVRDLWSDEIVKYYKENLVKMPSLPKWTKGLKPAAPVMAPKKVSPSIGFGISTLSFRYTFAKQIQDHIEALFDAANEANVKSHGGRLEYPKYKVNFFLGEVNIEHRLETMDYLFHTKGRFHVVNKGGDVVYVTEEVNCSWAGVAPIETWPGVSYYTDTVNKEVGRWLHEARNAPKPHEAFDPSKLIFLPHTPPPPKLAPMPDPKEWEDIRHLFEQQKYLEREKSKYEALRNAYATSGNSIYGLGNSGIAATNTGDDPLAGAGGTANGSG
jgi:hypothetical protein